MLSTLTILGHNCRWFGKGNELTNFDNNIKIFGAIKEKKKKGYSPCVDITRLSDCQVNLHGCMCKVIHEIIEINPHCMFSRTESELSLNIQL